MAHKSQLKPHDGDDFNQEHESITLLYKKTIKPYVEQWKEYKTEAGHSILEMLSLDESTDSESTADSGEESDNSFSEEEYQKYENVQTEITKETYRYLESMTWSRPEDWCEKHKMLACEYFETNLIIVDAICESIVNEDVLQESLSVIATIADRSKRLAIAIVNSPGFLKCVYIALKCAGSEGLDDVDDDGDDVDVDDNDEVLYLSNLLTCVHNLSLFDEVIPKMREFKFSKVLRHFLSFPNEIIRLICLMALAGIITENESLDADNVHSIIDFLIATYEDATKSPIRRSQNGWKVSELTAGLQRLARIDGYKQILVKKGCLRILQRLVKSKDVEEQKGALMVISTLSFDESNQDVMIRREGLIDLIDKNCQTGSKDIVSICKRILWTMREKLQKSKKFTEICKQFQPQKATAKGGTSHIMISYQWDNQNILLKLRDKLKSQGKNVWMDVDEMHGSTLSAMADAVEKADVVIMCMSLKYKNSDNCRAEAEYSFKKKKNVIPLIMQSGYDPDGFLGMLLGTKLYYDFSDEKKFDTKSDAVLDAIRRMQGGDTEILRDDTSPAPLKTKSTKVKSIKSWTKDDVKSWLKRHSLSGARLEKITGSEISFLLRQEEKAPKLYYKALQDELGLKNLKDIADFEAAMDEIRPS